MIRVDIESILMASGPMPSLLVLRERSNDSSSDMPRRSLSIKTGSFEAAAISQGVDVGRGPRPLPHDLLLDVVAALDAKIERIEIVRADAPTFYANVVVRGATGKEMALDARPSDAISLAVRANTPMFVEDDVMNRYGELRHQDEEEKNQEFEKFDAFVQTLSPDDF